MKKLSLLFLWTVFYALAVALLFHALFNFDVWTNVHWHRLARITIRGIAGLAFGVSLLAAVPIYIAVARFILKNGKLPFKNPFSSGKKDSEKSDDNDTKLEADEKVVFPDNLPDELKEPYIRVRSGQLAKNAIDFVMTEAQSNPAPQIETAPDAMMPVPESFDAAVDTAHAAAPMFQDFNFGDEDESAPPPPALSIEERDGKKIATYVFSDPDFWVADDTSDWFATGKQTASPIKTLLDSGADEKILVLESKNIMNIDALIPEWEEKGIKVVLSC